MQHVITVLSLLIAFYSWVIHCPCGRWHKTVVGHPGPILWQMYDIIIFYQYIYFFRIFNARKILSGFVLPPPSLAQIISYLYWHVFCVYYQKLCCSALCIRFITIQPDQYKWRWRLYLYIESFARGLNNGLFQRYGYFSQFFRVSCPEWPVGVVIDESGNLFGFCW